MTTELIIDGVDHSKFNLEWAKRGGWVYVFEDYNNHENFFKLVTKTSDSYGGEFAFLSPELEVEIFNPDECEEYDLSNCRMATPAECEAAGIEYIEYHGWRPIESAPIGSWVLVTDGKWVGEGFVNRANAKMLTHWMPLQQVPKDE